jgi:hypothetical protein
MRLIVGVCLPGLLLLLVPGCSKEKKEEAARLEQEMIQQDSAVVESVDTGHAYSGETLGSVSAMDAGAVPADDNGSLLPTSIPSGAFTLQVAACTSTEYARHLIELYRSRGYEPYVSTTLFEGEEYHRVRIGGFESFSAASVLAVELKDKYSVSGWIDFLN